MRLASLTLLCTSACTVPSSSGLLSAVADELHDVANGIVVYVNPMNCVMDDHDAERLRLLAAVLPGLHVRVVFVGLVAGDTITQARVQSDLQLLDVPTFVRSKQSIVGADNGLQLRPPMVAWKRNGELRGMVVAEPMGTSIRILEDAFPTFGDPHTTQGNMTVFEIGTDFILAKYEGSVGEQHLRIHELMWR